jgi:hypothetical protein
MRKEPNSLEPLIVDRQTTCELLSISKNRYWSLIREGELEQVGDLTGKSRVTYASVKGYAEKRRPNAQGIGDRAFRMRSAKAAKRAAALDATSRGPKA